MHQLCPPVLGQTYRLLLPAGEAAGGAAPKKKVEEMDIDEFLDGGFLNGDLSSGEGEEGSEDSSGGLEGGSDLDVSGSDLDIDEGADSDGNTLSSVVAMRSFWQSGY